MEAEGLWERVGLMEDEACCELLLATIKSKREGTQDEQIGVSEEQF